MIVERIIKRTIANKRRKKTCKKKYLTATNHKLHSPVQATWRLSPLLVRTHLTTSCAPLIVSVASGYARLISTSLSSLFNDRCCSVTKKKLEKEDATDGKENTSLCSNSACWVVQTHQHSVEKAKSVACVHLRSTHFSFLTFFCKVVVVVVSDCAFTGKNSDSCASACACLHLGCIVYLA